MWTIIRIFFQWALAPEGVNICCKGRTSNSDTLECLGARRKRSPASLCADWEGGGVRASENHERPKLRLFLALLWFLAHRPPEVRQPSPP